ncbi:hypothetical protein TRFO_06103 [Tritrichomonas foetus]|uniref:Uncharacterized protein n=1 Tax=Tritrichomonas foetus TaxID=1144522 RepID=A0A1J4K5T8_9EUKA|nr:hypothetical protein TRFO_06103 [Tritrichomonas foetus]|eukprot:OHT05092.1 hypothetical protein TRFO_06103 [Tritrichomonas foetus]
MQEKFQKLKSKFIVTMDNANAQIDNLRVAIDALTTRYSQSSQEVTRIDALLQALSISITSLESDVKSVNADNFNASVRKLKQEVAALKTQIVLVQETYAQKDDFEYLSKQVNTLQKQIREFSSIKTRLDTQKKDIDLLRNAFKKKSEGSDNLTAIQDILEIQEKNGAEIRTQRNEIDELKRVLSSYPEPASIKSQFSKVNNSLEKAKTQINNEIFEVKTNLTNSVNKLEGKIEANKPRGIDEINESLTSLTSEFHEYQTSSNVKVDDLSDRFNNFQNSTKRQIEAASNLLVEKVNDFNESLNKQVNETRSSISTQIKDVDNRITNQVQEFKDNVRKEVQSSQNILTKQFNEVKSQINEQVQEYKLQVNEQLQSSKDAMNQRLQQSQEEATKQINDLQNTLNSQMNKYQSQVKEIVEITHNNINDQFTEFQKTTNQQLTEQKDDIEKRINDHQNFTVNQLKQHRENINNELIEAQNIFAKELNETKDYTVSQIKDYKEKSAQQLNEYKENLNHQIQEANDASQHQFIEYKEKTNKRFNDYQNNLNGQIQESRSALNNQLNSFSNEFEKQLREKQVEMENSMNETQNKTERWIKSAKTDINNQLNDTKQNVVQQINLSHESINRQLDSTQYEIGQKLEKTQSVIDQQITQSVRATDTANQEVGRQIRDAERDMNRSLHKARKAVRVLNEEVVDLKPTHREINRLKFSIRKMGGEIYDGDDLDDTEVMERNTKLDDSDDESDDQNDKKYQKELVSNVAGLKEEVSSLRDTIRNYSIKNSLEASGIQQQLIDSGNSTSFAAIVQQQNEMKDHIAALQRELAELTHKVEEPALVTTRDINLSDEDEDEHKKLSQQDRITIVNMTARVNEISTSQSQIIQQQNGLKSIILKMRQDIDDDKVDIRDIKKHCTSGSTSTTQMKYNSIYERIERIEGDISTLYSLSKPTEGNFGKVTENLAIEGIKDEINQFRLELREIKLQLNDGQPVQTRSILLAENANDDTENYASNEHVAKITANQNIIVQQQNALKKHILKLEKTLNNLSSEVSYMKEDDDFQRRLSKLSLRVSDLENGTKELPAIPISIDERIAKLTKKICKVKDAFNAYKDNSQIASPVFQSGQSASAGGSENVLIEELKIQFQAFKEEINERFSSLSDGQTILSSRSTSSQNSNSEERVEQITMSQEIIVKQFNLLKKHVKKLEKSLNEFSSIKEDDNNLQEKIDRLEIKLNEFIDHDNESSSDENSDQKHKKVNIHEIKALQEQIRQINDKLAELEGKPVHSSSSPSTQAENDQIEERFAKIEKKLKKLLEKSQSNKNSDDSSSEDGNRSNNEDIEKLNEKIEELKAHFEALKEQFGNAKTSNNKINSMELSLRKLESSDDEKGDDSLEENMKTGVISLMKETKLLKKYIAKLRSRVSDLKSSVNFMQKELFNLQNISETTKLIQKDIHQLKKSSKSALSPATSIQVTNTGTREAKNEVQKMIDENKQMTQLIQLSVEELKQKLEDEKERINEILSSEEKSTENTKVAEGEEIVSREEFEELKKLVYLIKGEVKKIMIWKQQHSSGDESSDEKSED